MIIGYKKNVDNYTILRFPSRCTKVTNDWNIYNSGIYNDTEDDAATIRSYTKNILKVELPDTVKELGESAFSGVGDYGSFNFSSLERIELSKNISKIETCAFVNCKNLKYVKMPENITEIGWMAFDGCEALESITVPEGVKKIGEHCFNYCTSLQQINLPEGLEEIDSGAFSGTKSLSEIIIPKSVKMIGSWAFFDWTDKQTIKFRATEAGENWDKHWNCTYYTGVGTNIIWGYQDNNT